MKIKGCGVLVLYLRQLEITDSSGGLDLNFTCIQVKFWVMFMRSKVNYIQFGAKPCNVGLEPAAYCLDVPERQTMFSPDKTSLCLPC